MNELTLEYEPRLATEYKISDDGLVYTFTLRKGVKFHNGEEMKASDVVFSYDHIKGSPTWSTFYSNIDYAEALDDYTVAVHFKTVSAAAMNNVSQIWIESEKEVTEGGETFGTKACKAGTGPYYIDSFSETNVTLKAFPDYYRGEASIKTVNYKQIAEATTGALALEAGELDYYTVPVASFGSYQGMDQFETAAVAANHITYACINYSANPVLENDKVREAIAYAIDKDAINVAAYGGYAKVADYMENPEYNVAAPKGDIVYNHDPEKAKALLAEAGYPNGCDIGKITVTASNYFPDVAVVIQANLEEVGIHSEMNVMENAACIAALRAQDYDLGVLGYTSTGDYDSFRQRVHSDSVGAYFVKFEGNKFDYKHFNQLFADQLVELDLNKRL
ncbi:MAG: ABC transporter substrate-binding protein, partial [Firmicutes bacterium]|nr:ABC transporter substrate-binding protein [Bacillota bacterium]